MILLLKLALAILQPTRSPDWIDERAHVVCYAILDAIVSDLVPDADRDATCDERGETDPADY